MADLTTLANVKQWLGLTATGDDALLGRLITSFSDYVETYLNRKIASQTYNEMRDGTGGRVLYLGDYPVTAVASLTIDGYSVPASSGPLQPGFAFDDFRLVLRGTYLFTREFANVAVTYTAGYATTPPAIEQAVIETVGIRYKEKDRIGVSSKMLAQESVSFTQKDLSNSTTTILANYRKVITA